MVRLKLTIQNAPVRDDNDRVEHPPVVRIMQDGKLVGEPSNGEALAASRRMLDQVTLTCPATARVADHPAHGIELMITREDQGLASRLPAFLILLFDFVDELTDKIEHAVARPDSLPQIAGRVSILRRRDGRVSGAAESPLVKRKKPASFLQASCVVTKTRSGSTAK